ncbi:DUF3352 domain-containing protein [Gloeocapsa sp. PCC 73106]|uniref:DUF3352 domain-containing protein n=1 Tax=Gloeocapsa sp. PCC 73106 TaxID=102232 RepID=UPI0002ACCE69|nr:DUF3352 domain-containing protein [Gloeocapsa sp. PCC 73106]ELR97961.1 Protein of unknown function (DUF3352) [Gloeocapsa sp. PCC 73106]
MKLRSLIVTLAVGVIALLLIAVISFSWIVNQSALKLLAGGVDAQPTGAMFVPQQAPVMLSLLVNPERLESLRQLTAPLGKRRQGKQELNQLKQGLLGNLGLNYDQDVKDWLGEEITLAITSLDFDRDSENGLQPGYLLVATSKDPEQARQFLQASYSKRALSGTSDLVFEQYKGINIIYQRPKIALEENNIAASAVVGEYVLFANHPKVLKDALNNVQAKELSLQNNPSYQQALNSLVDPRIGVIYLNLPAVSAWVSKTSFSETAAIDQLVTAAIGIKPQGLVAQTAVLGLTEASTDNLLSKPVDALNYVPSESVIAIAGQDLNQFWSTLTETEGNTFTPALKPILENLVASVKQIDLPQDIFSWVQGEYALALIPLPGKRSNDWIFVAEKVAEANLEQAIQHLDELAIAQGNSVSTIPLFERTTTVWSQLSQSNPTKTGSFRLDAQVRGVHTSIGNYVVFSSSLEALAKALSAPENPLIKSETWLNSVSLLPNDNEGYVYLNWQEGQQTLKKQFPLVRVVELSARPLFEHLRSLTLTSLGTEDGVKHATILFDLLN